MKLKTIYWIFIAIIFSWFSLTAQSGNDQHSILVDRHSAITTAIEEVSPAVAGISVTAIEEYRSSPFIDDPLFNLFFPDQYRRRQVESLGSGVVISPDGYVITNHHVVENAQEIIVTLQGGRRHEAALVGKDELSDIALLKIEDEQKVPFAKMGNSDDIIIGEWVIALGNPFGLFDISYKPTATAGIISGTQLNFGRQGTGRVYQDMIQTDAAINVGNSGGPLVNSNGKVIGINTFIFTGGRYSEGSVGIGFAIPINRVKPIIAQLKEHGAIDRSFKTGLSVQRIDPLIARYLNLSSNTGVIVTDIKSGSAADKSGIKVGDVIVKVGDKAVSSRHDIFTYIQENFLKAGDTIHLTVIRGKKNMKFDLKLE